MLSKQCIDCVAEGVTTKRPAKFGGPRTPLCHTHHRARKKAKSAKTHARHVETTFGLTSEEYWGLWQFQKEMVEKMGGTGVDPIDLRSDGTSRRLAVDHDHETLEVRGLLAGVNNFELLGRYDIDALKRAIDYLENPPARKYFGEPRYVPEEEK